MTKDELLNVPVVEKEKKVKKEVSDDALLSTFTTTEKVVEEAKKEIKPEPAAEVKEEAKPEPVVEVKEEVKPEPATEVKEEVKPEPTVEVKEESKFSEDAGINSVVQLAEEKVAQKVQEDGRNVELANNIVKETKIEENRNLPADVKPYLEIIKEKLKGAGRVVMNVLEMVGELVENIFKKKN